MPYSANHSRGRKWDGDKNGEGRESEKEKWGKVRRMKGDRKDKRGKRKTTRRVNGRVERGNQGKKKRRKRSKGGRDKTNRSGGLCDSPSTLYTCILFRDRQWLNSKVTRPRATKHGGKIAFSTNNSQENE